MYSNSTHTRVQFLVIAVLITGIIGGYLIRLTQDIERSPTNTTIAPSPQTNRSNCLADECLLNDVEYPISELSPEIINALNQALIDEYKAYATYSTVMDTFGAIRPFIMIARAEQQHISSLQGLYEKYGLTIPENNYLHKMPVPTSIEEACAWGVQAELANIKLYKENLLPTVKDYEDSTLVFTNLMNASERKHLPAFQSCD